VDTGTSLRFAVLALSLVAGLAAYARGASDVDVVTMAVLTFLSVYVVARYALALHLGVAVEPFVKLDFDSIRKAVHYGLAGAVLGVLLDSILLLFLHESVTVAVLSSIIVVVALYTMKRIAGLRGVRVMLVLSLSILGVLYLLGLVEEGTV